MTATGLILTNLNTILFINLKAFLVASVTLKTSDCRRLICENTINILQFIEGNVIFSNGFQNTANTKNIQCLRRLINYGLPPD